MGATLHVGNELLVGHCMKPSQLIFAVLDGVIWALEQIMQCMISSHM
jgi:hypothetical protein